MTKEFQILELSACTILVLLQCVVIDTDLAYIFLQTQ